MSTTQQSPAPRRWRLALANAALLLVGLLLAFAACELVLWRYEAALLARAGVFVQSDKTVDGAAWDIDPGGYERFKWQPDGNSIVHIKSANPRLVYELRPGVKHSDDISINEQGFRDGPFTEEKPKGVFRIVVLGDSLTFGWLQKQDEIYPELLERKLNEQATPGTHFEVYNMGVGGYNAEQEVELLKARALRYKPDMILVGYCSNDGQIGYDAGLWRHFTATWSRTYDFLKLKWMQRQENRATKKLVERSYEELAAIAKQHGLPIVVAIFPDCNDPQGTHAAQTEALCKRLGFDTVNLFPAFNLAGMENVITGDALHPNAHGHAIAAQEIYKAIAPRLPQS